MFRFVLCKVNAQHVSSSLDLSTWPNNKLTKHALKILETERKQSGRIGAAEGNNGQLIFRAEIGWDPISALPKNAGAPAMIKLIAVFALLVFSNTSIAHRGGVNAEGCHTNKKTGEYHCHAKVKESPQPESKIIRLDYEGFTVWLDCSRRSTVKTDTFLTFAFLQSGQSTKARFCKLWDYKAVIDDLMLTNYWFSSLPVRLNICGLPFLLSVKVICSDSMINEYSSIGNGLGDYVAIDQCLLALTHLRWSCRY